MGYNNCGGWCDTCFCFRDFRRALVAIGMLTLGCPIFEILVGIAVFTGYKGEEDSFEVSMNDGDDDSTKKSKITYQLYIAFFAADFVLAIFSVLLLYGNERSDEIRSRKFYLPWAILLPIFIVYECAINIYYFYNQFNNKYSDPLSGGHHAGYEVVPLVYWIVKDILYNKSRKRLLLISFLFVVMRIRSLTPIVEYVQEVHNNDTGCGCSSHRPAPAISLPAPVSISTGGGGCGCGKAQSQPIYGYQGGVSSGARTGFTTNAYSQYR